MMRFLGIAMRMVQISCIAVPFDCKKTGNFQRVPCLSDVSGRVKVASLAKAYFNGNSKEMRINESNGNFCTKKPKMICLKKNVPDEFDCKDKNFEPSHPP
jgi:hypothetical protein